jgi:hypothetical protein
VILQTTSRTFNKYVKDKMSATLWATHDIENLWLLSLETAMKTVRCKNNSGTDIWHGTGFESLDGKQPYNTSAYERDIP